MGLARSSDLAYPFSHSLPPLSAAPLPLLAPSTAWRTEDDGTHSPIFSSLSPRAARHRRLSTRPILTSPNTPQLFPTMSYHIESRDPRPMTPATMHSRPMTPGTPGTFDSGRPYGQYNNSAEYINRYDDPNGAYRSPQMGGTYYFNKEGGAAAAGTGAAAAATASGATKKNWLRRHPWLTALIAVIIVAAAVGAGVGGSMAGSSSKDSQNASTGSSGADKNAGGSSSTPNNGTSTNSTTPPVEAIKPLPKWNMTDPNQKMIGTSLGNWLVLERWLDEDWFTSVAGGNAWDEWTFTEALGPAKAREALVEHWDSWVQESDIEALHSVGINSIRIPVGYWAFVDSAEGEPYISKAGQLDRVQKVLGWLYKRGMYALIDLHGMPGSQSGDQASGHNTSNVNWFEDANIGYSYVVLNETIRWIQQSNYSSVVHSVCPVNEPKPNGDSGKQAVLISYYEQAYQLLSKAGLIMMFHNAFQTQDTWQSFATGKDPSYLAYNDNPYPGYFPSQSDQSLITSRVCQTAQNTVGFPVPVVMTEYSLINGVNSDQFDQVFYNTQISAYSWSGGAYFWTFKAMHATNRVLANPDAQMDQFSLLTLINNGVVSKVDTNTNALDEIKSLPNQNCGDIPTATWSNPSQPGAGYSGRRRKNRSSRTSKA